MKTSDLPGREQFACRAEDAVLGAGFFADADALFTGGQHLGNGRSQTCWQSVNVGAFAW